MRNLELNDITVDNIKQIMLEQFGLNINLHNLKSYVVKNLLSYKPMINVQSFNSLLEEYKKTYLNNSIKHNKSGEELLVLLHLLSYEIFDMVCKDAKFISECDPSQKDFTQVLNTKTKGLVVVCYYRIAHLFYIYPFIKEFNITKKVTRELMEYAAVITSIDIHPACVIGEGFFIDHGSKTVIGETCEIGNFCTIFNDVILGSKNVMCSNSVKRHPTLGNNVTICAGARVLGNIKIGNNVFISPQCVVLEDIEDDSKVTIVNQVQILNNTKSNVSSQKMVVFGVVPKFKNVLIILGEGFYNPTVLIKLKQPKDLFYNITYWDKNKIIIKFKNTKPIEKEIIKNAKIIILSNNNKVVLLNNYGLEKTLTSLS